MITFSKLGQHGRLGNQLFQIASTIGIAKKHICGAAFQTAWVYAKYFKKPIPVFTSPVKNAHLYKEETFHYAEKKFTANQLHYVVDLFGYFQSEKYFSNALKEVKEQFTFKDEFVSQVSEKYKPYLDHTKKIIAISIRRGDYVNNHNYAQLPITWYYTALEEHFKDWKTNANVIIFSDDIEYCKLHFGNYKNVFYADNKTNYIDKTKYFSEDVFAMEQLCLMTLCDHFIIANSSFSWWGAWLGRKSFSKIIRPKEVFAGKMKENNSIKDYYPEDWICFEGKKIDLSDVTFTIPVAYDHPDRLQNTSLNVCMLQRDFDTNIIITEQFSDRFSKYEEYGCVYKKYNWPEFHRTKMLNEMAKMAKTDIVVNWDADVFISPLQILQTVESIREGADMVFPYDGRFARVGRQAWFKSLEKGLDVGIFGKTHFAGMSAEDKLSVGGAIFFKKSSFFEGGGENEYFISYGPEDVERDVRFRRLNYDVRRISGVLYHMDHWKGPNSKSHNKFHKQNHDELDRIYSLKAPEGLREYVAMWPWVKQFKS